MPRTPVLGGPCELGFDIPPLPTYPEQSCLFALVRARTPGRVTPEPGTRSSSCDILIPVARGPHVPSEARGFR
eukprot:766586-Hanusia_phi.AAC.8